MELTPDQVVFWRWGFVELNATLLYSWLVMALLVVVSWLITRRLSSGLEPSRGQNMLESVVGFIQAQIRDVVKQSPRPYLPFIGTLYLYIAVANFFSFVPLYEPPTASFSTTAALAVCVFVAVPVYAISQEGWRRYLRHFVEPTPLMLPFRLISEVSRTLALAVRLFGNVMSGTILVAILFSIAPLLFPAVVQVLELLIGQIQAYIFAVLAIVYIASATRRRQERAEAADTSDTESDTDHTNATTKGHHHG